MTLAKRITESRLRAGLTQTQLAQKAGISQQAINKLESGGTKKSNSLIQIAAALRVNVQWLATGEGRWDQASSVDESATDRLAKEVKAAKSDLDDVRAAIAALYAVTAKARPEDAKALVSALRASVRLDGPSFQARLIQALEASLADRNGEVLG